MWSVPRCYKQGTKLIVQLANDRPGLSSERARHINKPATDSNKDMVVSPRWVLYSKTDGPTEPSVVT
jgi:hypothetical protein